MLDKVFTNNQVTIRRNEERIIEIEIERFRPFKEHPFQVKDDNNTNLSDTEMNDNKSNHICG